MVLGCKIHWVGWKRFFEGKSDATYWIGYDKDIPFAFLITSPEGKDGTTLDVFICEVNYLSRGLAVPMIRKFLIDHFSHLKKVLIDPEEIHELFMFMKRSALKSRMNSLQVGIQCHIIKWSYT